jgi:hypothetical protein
MQSNEPQNQIGVLFKGLFPVLLSAGALVAIIILMVTDALSFDQCPAIDPDRLQTPPAQSAPMGKRE